VLEPGGLQVLLEVEGLAGLKDGHRDVRRHRQLRGAAGGRLLWLSAWEDVALAFWATGCDAYAPASTAYAPGYARAWLAALDRGDVDGARALLEAHAYPLTDLRLSRPGIDVAVVKAVAGELGLELGDVRPPAQPLTAGELGRVRELAGELDALLSSPRAG
jgi:5-dehydro-4-deoxyglucarate dehydratase